jgi:hypothetical protein
MKTYYIEALVFTKYKTTRHKVGLCIKAKRLTEAMVVFKSNYERVFEDKIYCDFTELSSFEGIGE